MSYCRFSTVLPSNHESDLYVYDHVDGYIAVHVARSRREGVEQAPLMKTYEDEDWVDSYLRRSAWMKEKNLPLVPIDLPHAGEDFQFSDGEQCAAFLTELRALGYRFPDALLDHKLYE